MNLLDEELPNLGLTIDVTATEFFDRCETLATARGWKIDRRREYAGPGYEQLNLYLEVGEPGYPMLRMVATPKSHNRLDVDVIASWRNRPVGYDEYLDIARAAYSRLLDAYAQAHGKRLRLGVPHRPPTLDLGSLDCNRIKYAREKFMGLSRTLATGEGDARDRLISAFSTFHVISPEDLPSPLREHMQAVYDEITRKPARHQWEGSVEATVRSMKNSTAARVLERLLGIDEAIKQLEKLCDDREAAGKKR
jgi:hypothetical protein